MLALLALLAQLAFSAPVSAQGRPAANGTPTAARRLTLAEALDLATRSSESLEIAKAGVLRARGQQYQARSASLPQLSASANYQKTLENQFQALAARARRGQTNSGGTGGSDSSTSLASNPLTLIFASPYTTTLAVSGQQSLYNGGRNVANVRAANAGRQSAEIGVVSANAQVTLDATEAYYDAVLSDNLVAIAESSLLQTERTLRQASLTKSVGSTSEFELLRARVTRDNQRPQFIQARTSRDLAYLRLKQLLDVPLDQSLSLVDDIETASDTREAASRVVNATPTSLQVSVDEVTATDSRVRQLVDSVVASSDTGRLSRAPVRQATAAVEVAKQQLKASRASRLPTVGLTSTYQRLAYPANGIPKSLGDFYPNWTLGLGVTFPFFTGGRVKGELLAAQASVIEAEQRLQQAQKGATLDARQSIAQLLEAQEAWVASLGTSDQANRAYNIAEVRYREGISTQVELSESRVQLQQAQANRARAARDLQVARIRLKLLRDLPLGGNTGAAVMGAAAGAGSTTGTNSGASASGASTQRTGQPGSTSPGGNTP
ncbi:MAG: TolC family protein [Gemmatimonadota bacterium]|nr:TolC family protein [Gemmatimonadota bacterium]